MKRSVNNPGKPFDCIDLDNVHIELYDENDDDAEIYIGGYFLCGVDLTKISPEAKKQLLKYKNG